MIEVGVIGAGQWGPNLIRSIEDSGKGTVRWVCDLDEERLSQVAARHPRARTTTDVDEILTDAAVGAVVVATPVETHFELARRSLAADKHLLVEKPLASSSAEVRQLIALAAERRRRLMVGHVFEYNASIRALRRLVADGELGEIHYMSFVRTNLGPVRTDVNAFWDLASHDVSIMRFLMGCDPVDVTARGRAYLNRDIEDAVFATFGFPGGQLAHVDVSWLNPRKVRQITVVGDRKMALWDDLDLKRPIQVYDRHVEAPGFTDSFLEYKTTVVDGGVHIPSVRLNRPLAAECEHFLDSIAGDRRPDSDGESALAVILALEAASESMANGSRVVPIPAVE